MSLRTLLPFQPIDIVPPRIPLSEYNNRLNPLGTHNLYRVPREDDPRNALPPEPAATKSSGLSAASSPALSCIFDKKTGITYTCRQFLGEGGFARCYEVVDPEGNRFAAKTVKKESLRITKNRDKLLAEIKIHRSMNHKNIVKFYKCFEDSVNVYMLLELCEKTTMMEMVRSRRRLTEPEARYYMLQMLDACAYMHSNRIIHRDLKLGNLFLTEQMDCKIGDFGLAARLLNDDERKKTICGTPNYIAPEILFDQQNGHSYEVDVWSLGIIMYTILIGRPPFQTKEVKAIYKKIKENQYEFPPTTTISANAKNLIQRLLNTNPDARPQICEIIHHPFFTEAPIPTSIPYSALHEVPLFPPQPAAPALPVSNPISLPTSTATGTTSTPVGEALMQATTGQDRRPLVPLQTQTEEVNQEVRKEGWHHRPMTRGAERGGWGRELPPTMPEKENKQMTGMNEAPAPAPIAPTSTTSGTSARHRRMLQRSTSQLRQHKDQNRGDRDREQERPAPKPEPELEPEPEPQEFCVPLRDAPARAPAPARTASVSSVRSARLTRSTSTNGASTNTLPSASSSLAGSMGGGSTLRASKLGSSVASAIEKNEGSVGGMTDFAASGPSRSRDRPESTDRLERTERAEADRAERERLRKERAEKVERERAERAERAERLRMERAERVERAKREERERDEREEKEEPMVVEIGVRSRGGANTTEKSNSTATSQSQPSGMIEAMHKTLDKVFTEKSASVGTRRSTRLATASARPMKANTPPTPPKIFISKWIDYTNKYGLGYTLTDGSVGMYFNDATTIVIAPDEQNFEYICSSKDSSYGQAVMTRKAYPVQEYPAELQKKMYLMKYFREYMSENLFKASYVETDAAARRNLDFLTKYTRTKHAVMFRMSNRVLQINFFDHTKVILSEDANVVSFIDKNREFSTYHLEDCFDDVHKELLGRLKYAKDILGELIERRVNGQTPGSSKTHVVGK